MLSDELVHNTVLHRPQNSKLDNDTRQPFVIPINPPINPLYRSQANTSLSTRTTTSKYTTVTNVKDLKSVMGGRESHKSIRILRPETLKRAINDACIAASLGDLNWLKQCMLITNEIHFDKNGFATLHLASIHGRLNILKYLIEEQLYDVNLPSQHGWQPCHLCINGDIGVRSVDCLKYLIDSGANINCTNQDQLTPLHMAAAEGHFECLKLLLDLKADFFAKDCRNHTPLDLAILWGHRNCAKLLNSYIWHVDKKEIQEQEALVKRKKTQDVLKEIEESHYVYYGDSEESEKQFDRWLVNQGFLQDDEVKKQADAAASNKKLPNVKKKEKKIVLSSYVSPTPASSRKSDMTLSENLLSNKKHDNESDEKTPAPTKKVEKLPFVPLTHPKAWDYSTKADEKDYVTNLTDFYPRDPYTLEYEGIDLFKMNKELKGMSVNEVKEFMKKPLGQLVGQSGDKEFKQNRPPFYYKPKYIIDAQTKYKLEQIDEKRIDHAGMTLANDADLFQFKQAKKFVAHQQDKKAAQASSHGSYFNTNDTLKLIKSQLNEDKKSGIKDEKLEIVKKNYGQDLSDFMRDKRHDKMDQRYEKVFIC